MGDSLRLTLERTGAAAPVGPLPIVRGDRSLLGQALGVLTTFALSETRSAQYVAVQAREVQGETHVTVQDDGIAVTGEAAAATLFGLAVRPDREVSILRGSGGRIVLAFPRDETVKQFGALFRTDRPGE